MQAVTYDASEAAGCAAGCINNTRAAISQVFRLSQTPGGRRALQHALRLCDELPPGCAADVAYWVQVILCCQSPPASTEQAERPAFCASRDRRLWLFRAHSCQSVHNGVCWLLSRAVQLASFHACTPAMLVLRA